MKIVKKGNRLQELLAKVKDPTPALAEIGEMLATNAIARILFTKTAPDGSPWAPWAPSTLKARTKKGTAGNGILHDSGTLADSITWRVSGKQVEYGVDIAKAPYAGFLQNGTSNMPARPFIGISAKDQKEIQGIVTKFLKGR